MWRTKEEPPVPEWANDMLLEMKKLEKEVSTLRKREAEEKLRKEKKKEKEKKLAEEAAAKEAEQTELLQKEREAIAERMEASENGGARERRDAVLYDPVYICSVVPFLPC